MEISNIYVILVIMLLGAFLVGIYFGANYFPGTPIKKVPAKTANTVDHANDIEEGNFKRPVGNSLSEAIDVAPQGIRATQTRNREGSLTQEARREIIESKINFNRLGRGDARNADDFKKIVGIGPLVEEKLNDIGIYNYSQLVNLTDQDIEIVTSLIDFFPGRIVRDDWRGQASALLKGNT